MHLMLQMGASTKQGTSTIPHSFNATMEVDASGGVGSPVWVPYNRFVGIIDTASWIADAQLDVRDSGSKPGTTPAPSPPPFTSAQLTQSPPAVYMKADPRATRFGIFQFDTNPTTSSRIMLPLWPSNSSTVINGYGGTVTAGPPGPVEHAPFRFASVQYLPATFCINDGNNNGSIRNTVTTNYADNDGITRRASAAYPDPSRTATGSSTPYYTTDLAYHPIILNRPFRNVGELGYTFRDLPWKSLDMFSDTSADAGLLDIFSVNDEPAMVAGRTSLNTQQAPVLQSVLSGAIWDELDTTNTVTANGTGATTAATMATNITTATSTTPLRNKSDAITRSGLPTTILPLPGGSQDNQTVKARREVVQRAVSSVSQTRVWNLLIDVVAQSGRYAPGETDLKKFIVEGEQHYWVHVAIDRFTGEVIDRQIEVVKE
jgi:hypothetical protein